MMWFAISLDGKIWNESLGWNLPGMNDFIFKEKILNIYFLKIFLNLAPRLALVSEHTATQLSEKLYQDFLGFPRPEIQKIINLW